MARKGKGGGSRQDEPSQTKTGLVSKKTVVDCDVIDCSGWVQVRFDFAVEEVDAIEE